MEDTPTATTPRISESSSVFKEPSHAVAATRKTQREDKVGHRRGGVGKKMKPSMDIMTFVNAPPESKPYLCVFHVNSLLSDVYRVTRLPQNL